MSATIYDVAKKAGVGIGTVSRVLNNNPKVSQMTRQRVLAAMQALHYTPNPFARGLSTGRALSLAVIAPFFTRASSVERLRGVEAMIAETEYDLIVYNVETPTKRDYHFRQLTQRTGAIDGFLIISFAPTDQDAERFRDSNVPLVLVDTSHPVLSHVMTDDMTGGYLAARHLVELGHRRIAFLGDHYPNPFNFTSSYKRYLGYRKALGEAGLEARPEYTVTGEFGRDEAREMAYTLLDLAEPPTAIVAASDTQAIGVLEAARDLDVQVPEELSVVGYDDIEIAEYLRLTTIHQPLFESGWRGAQLLFYRIRKGAQVEPVRESLPVTLIVRETTAPPGRRRTFVKRR